MKKVVALLLLAVVFNSCNKKTVLESTFNCSSKSVPNSKRITDFKNNFSIALPLHWKTDLYYNSYQSEIFSADTTKQLSESFILKISSSSGVLEYNNQFFKKIDSVSKSQKQTLIISQTELFEENEMYWNVFKSVKKGYTFHQFNAFIKTSNKNYLNASVDIYGDSSINERLCEAVSLLKTLEF